ncbi:MAG TPA: YihY/virulence factor BrkB family protein [Gemmatimonadales bacterium]|nr:YihY/virulence factor BrkB family protein [Gemmatimonadales bacterium]
MATETVQGARAGRGAGRPGFFGLLKESVRDFLDDDCPDMAAALSYYTIFSLPPLLLLILLIAGAVMDPQDVQGALEGQIGGMMGPAAAEQIHTILQRAERPGAGGLVATVFGVVVLLVGATGAFGQLQKALNRAWEVGPDPERGGIKSFLTKRLFSFGMILVVAFMLLVSLVLSAALSAFGDRLSGMLGGGVSEPALHAVNFLASFAVVSLLFALMFKVLPDAVTAWRDVWVGAAVTTLLFVLGKILIGFYLGRSNPGEAFGAAASLAIILVWIYYASMIVLFGAEFTQAWAVRRGHGVEPEPGAVRVERETRWVRPAPRREGAMPGYAGPERRSGGDRRRLAAAEA